MYFKPDTQTVFTTHSEIRGAFPNTSFPAEIDDSMLEDFGVYLLIDGHTFGEAAQAALDKSRVAAIPTQVTMRQARLALLAAGLLDTVETAIMAAGPAAKIEWEYAQEVQRASGLVPAMATALGMTEAQIDALFVTAATL